MSVYNEQLVDEDELREFARKYLEPGSGGQLPPSNDSDVLDTDIRFYGDYMPEERSFSMAALARLSEEGFKDMAKEVQEMGYQFFEYFNREDIPSTRRYITDVITFRNERELYKMVQELYKFGKNRKGGMFGYSIEEDHIHVIHDCSFSDGTCRDQWRKAVHAIGNLKPIRKHIKFVSEFTKAQWYDVFIYFFLQKRGTRQIWFGGESWKEPTNGKLYMKLLC